MKSIFDKDRKEKPKHNPNNYVNKAFGGNNSEFIETSAISDNSKFDKHNTRFRKRYSADVHVIFLDASFREFEREAKQIELEKREQKKREAELERLEAERLEAEKEAKFRKRTRSCPGSDNTLLSFYL